MYAKVDFGDTPESCWVFNGARSKAGYGMVRRHYTHRLSYEYLVGPIPEKYVIDHLCRNVSCCNPAHLEAVTHMENCRRGLRGRMRAHCKNGHELTHVRKSGYMVCVICQKEARRTEVGRIKNREASARYLAKKKGLIVAVDPNKVITC